VRRGLVVLLAGAAWFTWGGPAVVARIDAGRGRLDAHEPYATLRGRAQRASGDPKIAAMLDALSRTAVEERAWERTVGGLLTPAERTEGLARASSLPPSPPATPGSIVEPELVALLDALQSRYGSRTAPPPPVPAIDNWPLVDRRSRAMALRALLLGPGLDEERAAQILTATLDLLTSQRMRYSLEDELALALVR
jgi:hypothetical protein